MNVLIDEQLGNFDYFVEVNFLRLIVIKKLMIFWIFKMII